MYAHTVRVGRSSRSALTIAVPGAHAAAVTTSAIAAGPGGQPLPYGPLMRRIIRPLQHGFLVLNRWFMVPAIRAGFAPLIGNPLTGHLMLLRTRGRRTGLRREAPLGYVILDGVVYCLSGYGLAAPWVLNLQADPDVEVALPMRTFRGRATVVTGDAEWLRAYRALITSFGLVGHILHSDPSKLDDATLLATHGSLPVIRIEPVDTAVRLESGPWDPGGRGWLLSHLVAVAVSALAYAIAGWARRARRLRRT